MSRPPTASLYHHPPTYQPTSQHHPPSTIPSHQSSFPPNHHQSWTGQSIPLTSLATSSTTHSRISQATGPFHISLPRLQLYGQIRTDERPYRCSAEALECIPTHLTRQDRTGQVRTRWLIGGSWTYTCTCTYTQYTEKPESQKKK